MKNGILTVVSCVACAGLATAAVGQNFEVRLNGTSIGTFPSGSNQTINLGTLPAGNQELQIFDPNPVDGEPDDSAGVITIKGASGGTILSVWVADASVTAGDAFANRRDPIPPGLRNFGGLQFVGNDDAPADISLQQNTVLAATVRGDITGPITVGNIFRVDARRTTGPARARGTV